jgi:hypothetical protein
MSAVDTIFVFFYIFCGITLGTVLAKYVGPIYGIVGFFVGFVLPMVLWCFIARRIDPLRNKKTASEKGKVDQGHNKDW